MGVACYDTKASFEAIWICQRLGFDHITASEIIHWLMDLYEEGIITAEDTDGIPMELGSGEAMLAILKKMAFREGIGNVLADGILPAAKAIGRDSEYYVNHNRGLPMTEVFNPAEAGVKVGALSIVVSSRGDTFRSAAPLTSLAYTPETAREITGIEATADFSVCEGKPELVKFTEDIIAIVDSVSFCKFHTQWASFGLVRMEDIAAFLSAGTGRAVDVKMLFEDANKVRTLEHAYLLQEGYTREKQVLPERFFEPIESGMCAGLQLTHEELEWMKTQYYKLRGWDENTGFPTEETLKGYGLKKVAQDLKAISA